MAARFALPACAALLLAACGPAPVEVALPFQRDFCVSDLEARPGESVEIPTGGCIVSPSGGWSLVMQPSGVLDLAPVGADGRRGAPVWSSQARGDKPGSAFAALQPDGNLVVYDRPGPRPIWNSESMGPIGAYRLEITDSGELLVRPAEGDPLWSSRRGKLPAPGATPAPVPAP